VPAVNCFSPCGERSLQSASEPVAACLASQGGRSPERASFAAGSLGAAARFLASAPRLGNLAVDALLEEARLTPKPALVDQRGRGAHHDLDLATMVRSAEVLRATFEALAQAGLGATASQALREQLAMLGRDGERAMLAATGGSNTHRGAIWIVGLLVAGAAIVMNDLERGALAQMTQLPKRICSTAAEIAQHPDRFAPRVESNGSRVVRQYQVGGARQEARDGFPHVIEIGLPALHAARARGIGETHAQLDTLLAIMATLGDTCLLHRGGPAALRVAQQGAHRVLALGGSSLPEGYAALLALDALLIEMHASPGGAADLLAATLFVDKLLDWTYYQEA